MAHLGLLFHRFSLGCNQGAGASSAASSETLLGNDPHPNSFIGLASIPFLTGLWNEGFQSLLAVGQRIPWGSTWAFPKWQLTTQPLMSLNHESQEGMRQNFLARLKSRFYKT